MTAFNDAINGVIQAGIKDMIASELIEVLFSTEHIEEKTKRMAREELKRRDRIYWENHGNE